MTEFLQSNVTLVIGAALLLALIAVRAGTADKLYRRDLAGALVMLTAFLVLRSSYWLLKEHLGETAQKLLRVGWMLTFAFGAIRGAVSTVLRMARFRAKPTPKILRDVIDFTLYSVVALPILKSQLAFDLTGLFATSAIVSVVIGLALQDTLGNLFAGLSIQLERPFQVGDFVTVREHTGRVMQIAWRATRIETGRREVVTVPNSIVSKEAVKNYSRGYEPVGVEHELGVSYDTPPNQVKAVILESLHEVANVLHEPAATCRIRAFGDSAVTYRMRFFVADFAHADATLDEVLTRLWYRLRREGMEIPYPHRMLVSRPERRQAGPERRLPSLIAQVDFLQGLAPAEQDRLAREFTLRQFGAGEKVIAAGSPGHTFYVVAEGEVSVRSGTPEVEVTRLRSGQYFGEMSLLTGEPRAASVTALQDTTLFELDRPAFAQLFAEHPGLARQLSARLAERRTQLRAAAQNAGQHGDGSPEEGRIFGRLRQIFGLVGD